MELNDLLLHPLPIAHLLFFVKTFKALAFKEKNRYPPPLLSLTKGGAVTFHIHDFDIDPKDLVGRGAFAYVYAGKDCRTGSPIVAKISDPMLKRDSSYKDVQGEASLLERIARLPHVIQMRGSFQLEPPRANCWTLILDAIPSANGPPAPNHNLHHVLHHEPPLSWHQILSCGKQLLENLLELKKRQIIHGDIKPQNIIFNRDSHQLTLIDFGKSKTLEDLKNDNYVTTVTHRAPEMFLLRTETDFSPDMWGLGVTFFELYTGGHLPFPYQTGPNTPDTLSYILTNLGIPPSSFLASCRYQEKQLSPLIHGKAQRNWKNLIQNEPRPKGAPKGCQQLVIDFLEKIFQYENRLTVEEALFHPLFEEDLQIHLDCEGTPRPMQKRLFLSTNGLEIPLTARCIHLPLAPGGLYSMAIVDTSKKCLHTFQTNLWPGGTLSLREHGFASPELPTEGYET